MKNERDQIISIIGEAALAKLEAQHFRVVLDAAARRAAMTEEDLYQEAKRVCIRDDRVAVNHIQRTVLLGYAEAAAIVTRMEAEGFCTACDHVGRRRVLQKAPDAKVEGS